MGIIRGNHISPGIYTNTKSIRTDFVNDDLLYKSTKGLSLYDSDGSLTNTIYFGYYPLKSNNGKYTEVLISNELNVPFKNITEYAGITQLKLTGETIPITNHEDITIPVSVDETLLKEIIYSGISTYSNVADNENTCVLLLISKTKYRSNKFDIIDERLGISIKNKFNFIYEKYFNGITYYLLCMYNENYAYSRVGKDKIIAPITIKS